MPYQRRSTLPRFAPAAERRSYGPLWPDEMSRTIFRARRSAWFPAAFGFLMTGSWELPSFPQGGLKAEHSCLSVHPAGTAAGRTVTTGSPRWWRRTPPPCDVEKQRGIGCQGRDADFDAFGLSEEGGKRVDLEALSPHLCIDGRRPDPEFTHSHCPDAPNNPTRSQYVPVKHHRERSRLHLVKPLPNSDILRRPQLYAGRNRPLWLRITRAY